MGNTLTQRGPREAEIQRAILDLLAATRVFAIRFNTLKLRDGRGIPIVSHSAGNGLADIEAFPVIPLCPTCARPSFMCTSADKPRVVWAPVILWIEVKRPGRRQTVEQISFEQRVKAEGHHYIVASSVDDVLAWLRKYGAKR